MAIDTRKVKRRPLRFNILDEMLAEANRIAAADAAGKLTRLGNWTAGQNFAHIAAFIDYGYEGFPQAFANPPWFVKLMFKFMRNKFLNQGMPQGVRIPHIPGGTTGADDVTTQVGLQRLTNAAAKLKAGPPKFHSEAIGPLAHEDVIRLVLRHAELHLGFLRP